MHFNETELAIRVTVWYALSELFTGRELQDYDYRWIAQELKDSGLNREEIFAILDQEVAPALQTNLLCNPTPVMEGWTKNDIKRLVTEYVNKKPTIIERFIPASLLLKQRRKYILNEINRLAAEMDKST
ncbi:hypothetical protein EV102420_02_00190 [Pseudescherichia vulneris NBRC 102420]|uniref:DUF7079 domain-containing protein n=1 Tax=Pseudescherichia vulneris NBRC 102420 TaxID=1115515 RepID=A0A090UUZ9_PSEVU|nr:hypothetical protein [Pseudescherichia vulneris]GAL56415.1 hypothetical protein EV102420_02_00190 [Pseudescherichia vulneris NBRC 102420]STQ61188.1 Uncharacterised protein [Pseudescherichia vulneris]